VVSVSELQPDSAPLQALEKMPLRSGIETHNIIATLTGTENGLGDWVVPYTSASYDAADSETIVRGSHGLIKDQDAIDIVIRLLRRP
jgi:hypothetical protein